MKLRSWSRLTKATQSPGCQHIDSYSMLLACPFMSQICPPVQQMPGAVQALGADTTSSSHWGLPVGQGCGPMSWGGAGWSGDPKESTEDTPCELLTTGQPCVGCPVVAQPIRWVSPPFAQGREVEAEEDVANGHSRKASWRRWYLRFGRWQRVSQVKKSVEGTRGKRASASQGQETRPCGA